MPIMPRFNKKATKIAWSILGEPSNLKEQKRPPKQRKINERLVFEETARVR